jgi:thiosulfate dehydrogenase [quinone] large subunit
MGTNWRGAAPTVPIEHLLTDLRFAGFWALVRVLLGWMWLQAGWRMAQDSGGMHGDRLAWIVGIAATLLGIAVILGCLTGPAILLGSLVVLVAITPPALPVVALQFAAVVGLVAARRSAGWIGIDRWLLPLFSVWRRHHKTPD